MFILGAARSGTSAMALALKQSGYEGAGEGHFFDLLANWSVALDRFRDDKGDDFHGQNDTTAARFAPGYLDAALDEIFAKAARAAFPSGRWIDKTPNSNMVHLAPRFLRIWPNARFIFMKRRFFENALSRARKFPDYDFRRNCEEWAGVMEAWLAVRDQLADVSVEIDQAEMARDPRGAASRVGELLGWDNSQMLQITDALAYGWPERTGDRSELEISLARLGWTEDQTAVYYERCEPMMRAFGYFESKSMSCTYIDC